jgi:hypothetical protein
MFRGVGAFSGWKFGFMREEVCTLRSALVEPNAGYLLGTDFFLPNAYRDFIFSAAKAF